MNDLSQKVARNIIQSVGASGQPPEYGLQYFTTGLEPYLKCLEEDYLSSFIADSGSAFKMIVGVYGGGKTHFQYCLRDLAWKHNYAVSYVKLSPDSTPFFKLELVYGAIANNLMAPLTPEEIMSGYEQGIDAFLRRWYGQRYNDLLQEGRQPEEIEESIKGELDNMEGIESFSFKKALKSAILALSSRQEEAFTSICQWLKGEGYDSKVHRQFGIIEKIDKTTAFKMIRSLVQVIRRMGYRGLVLLLDEAEQKSSMSTKQKGVLQSNLREMIDACGHTVFQGVLITYAVPDESFLDGKTQVYEALRQRLATVLEDINPTGVKIDLEKTLQEPMEFLVEVGRKLAYIYQVAYSCEFNESDLSTTNALIANNAYEQRYADAGYKRLFVKMMVKGLHYLRVKGIVPGDTDIQVGG